MHPLCESSLKVMQEAGAKFDPVSDFDDIAELNRLASGVTNGQTAKYWAASLEPAITVGNITLRRLSIGAEEWLDRAQDWFDDDHFLFLIGFAMSSTPDQLSTAWDADSAKKAVRQWRRNAKCSRRSLVRAVERFKIAEDASQQLEADVNTPVDNGWLIELLCKEYGETPDYWIWQCPGDQITMLARNMQLRIERENRLASGNVDPASEYIKSLFAFRKKEADLRNKKLGDA